jgi:hypothetical protein
MTTATIYFGYLAFVAAGVMLWLVTRSAKTPIANVAEMIERIMHHRTTRVAIMLAWWWVGWHFLVNVIGR